MSVNWSFPRSHAFAPAWRVQADAALPPRPRCLATARNVQSAPVDREAARALVDAGYMPLQRYIELFGASNAGEGEV